MTKLLIVDDSNIIRRAISKYLQTFDMDLVGTAGDGASALEIFKSADPDFVTMDITMPGMDGLSCLEEMIRLKPETNILIISALNDPETGLTALKKGAKGFLAKPFKEDQLLDEVSQILSENE